MTMKTILTLITVAITTVGCAQIPFVAPEWKVTVQAVDETGRSVPDVQASVGYVKPHSGDRAESIDGRTDTNGIFTASGRSYSRLYLNVKKDGYHSAGKIYDIYVTDKPRYEPWNPTITLPLKKIGQPIAMYAKSLNLGMPVFGKPAGFDLMIGDWVAPYGKGINTDIIFTGELNERVWNDSDYKLTVSFPKSGDGIQEFTVPESEKGSELRSPHEAPADGYKAEWVQFDNRKPKTPTKTNRDANRNYFFRVRTVKDHEGNIVSAHYGKIYGDFMTFSYYYNPTPNSRNIEFDPKQNLIKNLKFDEGVSAP